MLRKLPFLLLAFALSACTQATPPSTATPTATAKPTLTSTLTLTVPPTATPTASPTPFPPLSGEKPYLMVSQGYPEQKLLIYDQDGHGRQTVKLPDGEYYYTSFSPDRKEVAFYTGALGNDENLPLTLHIFNIADGTTRKVSDVVMEGYQQKLSDVTDKLKILFPERYRSDGDRDWANNSVRVAFQQGIYSNAWSPDGRSLAFAGQIDGVSSDVYVYDVESGIVQRLDDDIQSVWSLQWSLDGKKIVFENSIPTEYIGSTLHVAALGEKVIKDPRALYTGTWWSMGQWLSPSLLVITARSHTAGSYSLDTLNINTGRINHLWDDNSQKNNFAEYVIDHENKTILVNSHELSEPENYGLYIVGFDGNRKKILNGLYWLDLFFRGGEKHRFLASGTSYDTAQYTLKEDTIGIIPNTEPNFLGKFDRQKISVSPDYAWMVIYDEQHLYLYDKNDDVVKTFPLSAIQEILWRPDSQGIAYLAGSKLYFLSIPDGDPKQIDDCGGECSLDLEKAVWLP